MTVYVYRGIRAGWQPVGYRSDPVAADRLLSAVRRIRPQFNYRQSPGWPALP